MTVGNLDSRLTNADQSLTDDISKFSSMLAHLHSQLSKPLLDVVLMSWQLIALSKDKGRNGGGNLSGMVAFVAIWITGKVLKVLLSMLVIAKSSSLCNLLSEN